MGCCGDGISIPIYVGILWPRRIGRVSGQFKDADTQALMSVCNPLEVYMQTGAFS